VPQLKRLVTGFPPRRPGFSSGQACGVYGGQSGTGAGFLRVLRFPLPITPPISPSSKSPGASTIGLLVAVVPSGPNWTPPPTIPILIHYYISASCCIHILFTLNIRVFNATFSKSFTKDCNIECKEFNSLSYTNSLTNNQKR
jgi:hypothetical protein